MKRVLVSLLSSVFALIVVVIAVQPQPALPAISWFDAKGGEPSAIKKEMMQKLETEFLPGLKEILNPEQEAELDAALQNDSDLRKAFDSLTLTPEQKAKVGTLFKSLPKGTFATLTPAQKQEFFLKKKAEFIKGKEKFMPDMNAINEKKKAFMPDLEKILEKKKAYIPTPAETAE